MQNEIAFRTSPMITPFLFKKCCDQIESDIPDINLERINRDQIKEITMEDLVLEHFFERKYKPLTQITGWTDETRRPEYAYELKAEYADEFKELAREEAASDALYTLIMQYEYSFSDAVACEYKYGEYTEDPDELDEQINEYLLDKYMEED